MQVDQIKLSGIVERYIVFKTSGSIKERTQTSTEMGGGCQQNGCRKGFAYIKQLANVLVRELCSWPTLPA